MKVVLLKEVKNLGRRGEIKEVLDGYARNYLLPLGLAAPANSENVKKIKTELQSEAKAAETDLINVEKTAGRLDGIEIEISGRVSETGHLYAAVNSSIIVAKLKEMGFDIKKGQVALPQPIKELGEYEVVINLPHGLEAKINVIVSG